MSQAQVLILLIFFIYSFQGTPIPTSKTRNGPKLTFPTPGEGVGFCGIPAGEISKLDENIASIYEFPWSVLLKYGNGEYYGGGSLIHPRYVLTTAHSVTGPPVAALKNVTSVRLGEYNLTTELDCDKQSKCNDPPIDIDVEEITQHPEFIFSEFQHNIALIRLKNPAPYTDFIRPICLQPTNIPTNNKNLILVGWGRTRERFQSDVKLSVKIPLHDFNQCQNKYTAKLGEGQFCAGGVIDQYACGPGGSPLMFNVQDTSRRAITYQTGIASFGPRFCGLIEKPDVYTKITHYLHWIEENTYE